MSHGLLHKLLLVSSFLCGLKPRSIPLSVESAGESDPALPLRTQAYSQAGYSRNGGQLCRVCDLCKSRLWWHSKSVALGWHVKNGIHTFLSLGRHPFPDYRLADSAPCTFWNPLQNVFHPSKTHRADENDTTTHAKNTMRHTAVCRRQI